MKNEERKQIYLNYMLMKIAEEDWHGVCDCANDLRELEVEREMMMKYPYPPQPKDGEGV